MSVYYKGWQIIPFKIDILLTINLCHNSGWFNIQLLNAPIFFTMRAFDWFNIIGKLPSIILTVYSVYLEISFVQKNIAGVHKQ